MPKLKESIDVSTGNYNISSVTLNLSNIKYPGLNPHMYPQGGAYIGPQDADHPLEIHRVSDLFLDSSMINQVVSIHLKSPSCKNVIPYQHQQMLTADGPLYDPDDVQYKDDCPMVYTGRIRGVTHNDDKITFKLEDITEKKIHRDLPSVNLGGGTTVPDKYKNKPIPMTYGKLKQAPTVAQYVNGELTFMADSINLDEIHHQWLYNEDVGGEDIGLLWKHGYMSTYDEGYIPLFQNTQIQFIKDELQWDDVYNEILNPDWFDLTADNSLQTLYNPENKTVVLKGGLFGKDRVQGLKWGNPSTITLFDYSDDPNEPLNSYYNNEDYDVLTDGDLSTGTDTGQPGPEITFGSGVFASTQYTGNFWNNKTAFKLELNHGVEGAMFSKLERVTINGFHMPVRGDKHHPSGRGKWDGQMREFMISDNGPESTLNFNYYATQNFIENDGNYLSGDGKYFSANNVDHGQFHWDINTYEDVRALFTFGMAGGNYLQELLFGQD